ncbi:MAG: hypothetical protein ABFS37_01330 [Acidobacteriota bacterium]
MSTIGSIIMFAGAIGALIFWIMILIVAFKKHIGWGLGSLFIPFVGLVFVFMNWSETKTPFLRGLICVAVQIVGGVIAAMGASG